MLWLQYVVNAPGKCKNGASIKVSFLPFLNSKICFDVKVCFNVKMSKSILSLCHIWSAIAVHQTKK